MNVDNELYNLLCIKGMGENYLKKWRNIKEQYAHLLDQGSIYRPIAYTHHDYSHHCYNIYKIVGQVVLYKPQLSEQEWFILNVAILLHDFSMIQPNFDRLIHSKQSSDWLSKQMTEDTVLKTNLNSSEAEAIELIIQAHSDCKEIVDGKETITEYTLENEGIQDTMDCEGAHEVQVRFLAAVLRIADECDVTRSRLGEADFSKLDDNDKEQKNSKEQWLRLKCFKHLKRSKDNLILEVDDKYVEKHPDEKQDIERRIKTVVLKIRKQLRYVKEVAVLTNEHLAMFQLRKVVISSKELDNEYISRINNEQFIEDFPELSVRILDAGLANEISAKIDEDDLMIPGHYLVTKEHCERDWIDLRDIVADEELAGKIIEKITEEINTKYQNSETCPIIVGMEDNGIILASQIAYRLGYPFTYLVPCNFNLEKSSLKEKAVDFSKYDKIILVTDAVATFRTIGITCKKHGIFDKVCEIYTVLYREPKEKVFFHEDATELIKNMTACCDKYKMEVYDRKQCPDDKKGKCKAVNK